MIKAEVTPSTDSVKVRHLTKYARTKSMAAVMLGNVTLGKKAIGNLTGEFEDAITWEGLELPEAIKSRFRTAKYEDGFFDVKTSQPVKKAKALVAVENNLFYLP